MSTIKTNHQPRPLLDWQDLSSKEKADLQHAKLGTGFFRFKGAAYTLSDFERLPTGSMPGWDGSMATSATTGVLVAASEDSVVVGTWQA